MVGKVRVGFKREGPGRGLWLQIMFVPPPLQLYGQRIFEGERRIIA